MEKYIKYNDVYVKSLIEISSKKKYNTIYILYVASLFIDLPIRCVYVEIIKFMFSEEK